MSKELWLRAREDIDEMTIDELIVYVKQTQGEEKGRVFEQIAMKAIDNKAEDYIDSQRLVY